ncbi:hypothetical protein FGG78_21080 [Thioclava sp. BHET1]|nr:hypothetical protein FGG78_21080 [Thioclava sp. BHET1]
MSGLNLRKKFMRSFVGMTKYSRANAWLVLGAYLALVAVAVAFGHYLLTLPLSWGSAVLIAVTMVFIGTRLRGVNNIIHECSHSTFAEAREDNVVIGSICASLLFKTFKKYRDDHLSHHAHLGDYEMDHEFGPIEKLRLHDPLSPRTILRHLVTPLTGRHLPAYTGLNLAADDGKGYRWFKIGLLVLIALGLVAAPLTTLLFVVLPVFYVYPTLNYWTDCLDHAGLVGATDDLVASRNVLAPHWVRLLFFPRNDCYHLVHHLFPQVPARHLHTAHAELCSDPDYGTQPLAIRPTHKELSDMIFGVPADKKADAARNPQL